MPEQFQVINTLDELASAVAASSTRPSVIFKHSPTCGLSAQALESITEFLDHEPSGASWFLLPVRTSREVSAAVATQFGIRHESPQALVLFEEKLQWHGSHFRATAGSISTALARLDAAGPLRGRASR